MFICIDSAKLNFPENSQSIDFQIDILINRAENAVNLCEVKFYNAPIKLNEKLSNSLREKRSKFRELSGTKHSIFNTLITTFGIDDTSYNDSETDNVISMELLV